MIQLEPRRVYTMAEVAEALGASPRWFRDNRKKLMREGFPLPVSRIGRPRWWGDDLIAWLSRPRGGEIPAKAGTNVMTLHRPRSRSHVGA